MHGYLERRILPQVTKRLAHSPAVALLGPRQSGKSTLAKAILDTYPKSIYLDLELPSSLNKLQDAELYLRTHQDKLVCLDEIQRLPEIFPLLRALIDERRRPGRFLILGSASRDLLQQSSETLAGRISYFEISPFTHSELKPKQRIHHWLLGGFPPSILNPDIQSSFAWRTDYIRSFLERDIAQLGYSIPTQTLARLWRMLAHNHGQTLNSTKFADPLGLTSHTARKYIDILEQTFLIRTLPAYSRNSKKRLVKAPKVYIRDSGLLHALLDIPDSESLFSHPIYGPSYEGYVIENICSENPDWKASFYRTSQQAEIDLVLEYGRKLIAIEVKASSSPTVSRGFWLALEDIKPQATFIVAPVASSYPLTKDVQIVNIESILKVLREAKTNKTVRP